MIFNNDSFTESDFHKLRHPNPVQTLYGFKMVVFQLYVLHVGEFNILNLFDAHAIFIFY